MGTFLNNSENLVPIFKVHLSDMLLGKLNHLSHTEKKYHEVVKSNFRVLR